MNLNSTQKNLWPDAFKRECQNLLESLSIQGNFHRLWESVSNDDFSKFRSNMRDPAQVPQVKEAFSKSCVLYFPHNRFEEPAWLNEENLRFQVQFAGDSDYVVNRTNMNIINYSPLRNNQNWFFEIAYDRGVLELQTQQSRILEIEGKAVPVTLLLPTYSGDATNLFQVADDVVREITGRFRCSIWHWKSQEQSHGSRVRN